MIYNPGVLQAALAAAVGDDPQLVAELRTAFLDSVAAMVDQLRKSAGEAEWRMTALRLQGLGASFGAVALMNAAERAANGTPGDAAVLRKIERAIQAFDS